MGCGASAKGRSMGAASVSLPPPLPASVRVATATAKVPTKIVHKEERLQVHTFGAPPARPTAHNLNVREATLAASIPKPKKRPSRDRTAAKEAAAAAAAAASNGGATLGSVAGGGCVGGGGGASGASSLSSSLKARAKASPYPPQQFQHHPQFPQQRHHPTEWARELISTTSMGTTNKAVLFVDSPEIHEFAVCTSPQGAAARSPSPPTEPPPSVFGVRPDTAGSMTSETGCLDLFDFDEASSDRHLLGEIEFLVANMEDDVLGREEAEARVIISDRDEEFMQNILDDLDADGDDDNDLS